MKRTFLYLLLIISMISCSNPNGLLMKTSSTIQIEELDSEDEIIEATDTSPVAEALEKVMTD